MSYGEKTDLEILIGAAERCEDRAAECWKTGDLKESARWKLLAMSHRTDAGHADAKARNEAMRNAG